MQKAGEIRYENRVLAGSPFSRYLSFTDAAKELFIAQSTLSNHIAALESDVGFSLIDRKAGNRLTDKGRFPDGARTLLDGLDETLARC
ncbi:MAG: LysR family transcriptional regulator [Slackia sp.]